MKPPLPPTSRPHNTPHNRDTGAATKDYEDYFKEEDDSKRTGNYADVVNKYYDLATSFYEYGWGESFHFAHRYKWETLRESIVRHEHFLASKLNVKPGDKGTYLHFPNPNCISQIQRLFAHTRLTLFFYNQSPGRWVRRGRAAAGDRRVDGRLGNGVEQQRVPNQAR